MITLTDEQLNDYLYFIKNNVSKQYPEYFDIINFLYLSGIRIGDIFNFNNYNYVDENNISLLQSKNNTVRIFDKSIIPACTKLFLDGNADIVNYFTISHLNNYLNNIFKFNKLIADNRIINSYCFRYNRFKQYYKEFNNIQAVSNIMGEVNDLNTVGYVFKQIKTTSNIALYMSA